MPALLRLLVISLGFVLAAPARAEVPRWDDPAWYAAPPAPLDLTLTPDMGHAVASYIGPEGGTFSATAANGDVFTLTVPEGALFTETRITLIPVAAAEGLPEGAGPFSGAILQPEGLGLARTGWLEITPATAIPQTSRALWGFYGTGQDARGEISLPAAGDRIVIPIDHFSGAGVSIADRINLQLDRWRQRSVEDRVHSQLAELIRQSKASGNWDGEESAEAFGRDAARVIQHGWRVIASRPAATCADVKGAMHTALGLERNGQLLGVSDENLGRLDMRATFERYWSVCFPEEIELCLRTGDLPALVQFALTFERQRQLIGLGEDAPDPTYEKRRADLRAALERCGRFKLEVDARGQWRDPSDVAGQLTFRVDVPIRLTFTDSGGFRYLIEGEAPATGVSVSFADPECWTFHGHLNGRAMHARLITYEFNSGDHTPSKLEARATAPEILADIECDGHRMQPPMSPMVWAVAHGKDRNGEVFRLARFRPGRHPVLWEMDWTGQGAEDGLEASDTTKLRLIHIAQ